MITEPRHEELGLSTDALARAQAYQDAGDARNIAARKARPAEEGLLLLYPISRFSGYDKQAPRLREPIFTDPRAPLARDLVGLTISFPQSKQEQQVEAYLEGTVRWRPVE